MTIDNSINVTFHAYKILKRNRVTETELVYNNLSPNYTTRLNLEYCFEEKQIITTEIFECDREDREVRLTTSFSSC
uniref:Uncharacterized protein n=1 Tax=Schistosoma haematobium TaxID=6185 RepID=A0A094ZGG6_SCHHA